MENHLVFTWFVHRNRVLVDKPLIAKGVLHRNVLFVENLQNQQADSHNGHADNDSSYGDMVFSVFLRGREQLVQ